jgi:hypothetical protein
MMAWRSQFSIVAEAQSSPIRTGATRPLLLQTSFGTLKVVNMEGSIDLKLGNDVFCEVDPEDLVVLTVPAA